MKYFSKHSVDYSAFSHKDLDVSDVDNLKHKISRSKPDVIINCAAYNNVDMAEKEKEACFNTNALGVKNIAEICGKYGIKLVHFSTDYVFDGQKSGAYTEYDKPNPLCKYAKSKLAGETFVKQLSDYLIFRISWLYGDGSQNFIYKLLQWQKNNKVLNISYDEFSCPTSTKTVIKYTIKALENDLNGLYHLVNSGYASRLEWAKLVFKTLGIKTFIYPVSRNKFNLPAKRPLFSVMSNEKLKKALNEDVSYWDDEVIKFCRNMA